MEFLGNVFTNFIFAKLLSYEALVTKRVTASLLVTIKRSFVRSCTYMKGIVQAM